MLWLLGIVDTNERVHIKPPYVPEHTCDRFMHEIEDGGEARRLKEVSWNLGSWLKFVVTG